MSERMTVHLSGLRFYGDHGLYKDVDAWGNEFEVDVQMQLSVPSERPLEIYQTIDYSKAYEIIRQCFSMRTGLLENLAIAIADELEQAFPGTIDVSISIRKLNPPIPQFKGAVGITYTRKSE